MMQKKTLNTSIRCLFYLLGMLLIWEWVRPVDQLTDTGNLSVFLVFAVLSLLLHYLQLNWLVRFAFLSGYTVLSLQYLYFDVSFFDLLWIRDMLAEFKNNLQSVFAGEWLNLSNLFRSFLFFILIWLVTYLIHYWVTVKKNIFLFFLSTVIYLSFLDTFTIYDADQAIIRTVIIGFIFLGLLAFCRLLDREGMEISAINLGSWVLPLSLMLVLSTLFGFAAPKLDPQWPDPVPFFKTNSEKGGSGGNGKSGINQMGYSENDDQLGGSIEGNDTVIFYHNAKNNPYWKVEHKDFYTGKGWADFSEVDMSWFPNNQDVSAERVPENTSNIKLDEYSVDITVKKTYNHIVLPEPSYLKKVHTKDEVSFRFNELTEKVEPWTENGSRVKLNQYKLDYLVPSYDMVALKKVTDEQLYEEVPMWSEYTQLPEIPERVRELAYEITAGKTNYYDKVKAIENYFDRPEFVYDKTNIPYPETSEDYVDQFLFETQRGYCDNFSSAMIVLLRANDIPSRWAKGYTNGETSTYKGKQVKKVTNNNAHSWVEVYFPGTGWVPFEPTKGFSNSASFYDSSVESTSTSQQDMPDQNADELKKPESNESKTPEKNLEEAENSGSGRTDSNSSFWIAFTIVGIGLGFIAFYVYKSRRKWLPWIYIRRYKSMKNKAVFTKAYLTLLTQLKRAGVNRPAGQTLREYAVSVDLRYGVNEAYMQILTKEYEKIIYRGDTEKESFIKNFELWEKLIKKTTS